MATVQDPSVRAAIESELLPMRKNWGVILALGSVLTFVGLLAIVDSLSDTIWGDATLITILVFGIILAAGGVIEILTAFVARCWRGVFMHILVGILYVVLGVLMIEKPERAVEALTLVIAAGFMVSGLFRIVFSLMSERFPGWQWVLFNGVITLLMGGLIWRSWPESATWVIGLFVGVELFTTGWTWVVLAMALRRLPAPAATAV